MMWARRLRFTVEVADAGHRRRIRVRGVTAETKDGEDDLRLTSRMAPYEAGDYHPPFLNLTVNEAQILVDELATRAGIRAAVPANGPALIPGPRPDWARVGGSVETDQEYMEKHRRLVRLNKNKRNHTPGHLRIKIRTWRWESWKKGRLLKAVKAHCLWCVCGDAPKVEKCCKRYCALWPWRLAVTQYRGAVVALRELEQQKSAWSAAKQTGRPTDLGMYMGEWEGIGDEALKELARRREFFGNPETYPKERFRAKLAARAAWQKVGGEGFRTGMEGVEGITEEDYNGPGTEEDWNGWRETEATGVGEQVGGIHDGQGKRLVRELADTAGVASGGERGSADSGGGLGAVGGAGEAAPVAEVGGDVLGDGRYDPDLGG